LTVVVANLTRIDPGTAIGRVRLTAGDADRAQRFYERALGLQTLERDGNLVRLGPEGGPAVVELAERPDAPQRPPGTTGLFHLAILVPTRAELARALRRVAEAGWRFTGASDHLVSEALYLNDPEGNGIEIYRDRPRAEWRYDGGQLQMATLPLDLDNLIGELDPADPADPGMAPGTRIGHTHLNVADIDASERFYVDGIGFDPTVRGYPGALFVSAGGYHHHLGLNTWAGAGAPSPPPGARGLDWFEVVLPDADALRRTRERIGSSDVAVEEREHELVAVDPSGNRVLLSAADS
jgi:catechol 2,3-dioxygenase